VQRQSGGSVMKREPCHAMLKPGLRPPG
jgi:hypothetical protein